MPVDVRRKGEDGFFGSLAIWAALFACKAPYHQDRVRKNADALLKIKMGMVCNLLLLMCSPLPLIWWLRIPIVVATYVNQASNLVEVSDPYQRQDPFLQLKSPSSELCQGDPPFDMLEFIRNYRFVTSFFCLTLGLSQRNDETFLGRKS